MNDEAAVAWLREQVQMRAAAAHVALDGRGEWAVTRNGDFDYTVFPYRPITPGDAVADAWREDIAAFIAANDPQQIIADCEADLAILDEHYILSSAARTVKYGLPANEAYDEYSVITSGMPRGPGDRGMGCVTCHYYTMGAVKGFGVCRTVKAVASKYRHQDGYSEHWGEPAGANRTD